MKISVTHSTVYSYDQPVSLEPHIFRLRPRTNSAQRLLTFEMKILPEPVGSTECLDQDGNLALQAWFGAPANELSVSTRFEIEMLRENPFEFVLPSESLRLPMTYSEPLATALAPYRNDGPIAQPVKHYANAMAASANGETLGFLTHLTTQIFRSCKQVIRPDGAPLSSGVTLGRHEGSCRDFAVLFCDACRTLGFAARFVSGYESAAANAAESYMHAWAEVYLPGAGWRAYDPARGLAVTQSHVAVAAAFHPDLAGPVVGTYIGSGQSRMTAKVEMILL